MTDGPAPDAPARIRPVDRLDVTETGEVILRVVWALRPGRPQIVAICSDDDVAARYEPVVKQLHPGAVFHVEKVHLDHLFGRKDIQTMIYRAAERRDRTGD